jgi:Zn-dependent protease with chaperone function
LVFVTRPLLEFCAWNREEVAFVLGHEMGHVACRHARDKLLASVVASTISLAHPLPRGVAALADAFVWSEYSRDSELEADRFAVRLLRTGGFDANGATRFLERLARRSQAGSDSGDGPGLFATHPPLDERLANIAKA